MWSSETKFSCIKTELKRCTMTESLWNRCDISRKSPDYDLLLLRRFIAATHSPYKMATPTAVGRMASLKLSVLWMKLFESCLKKAASVMCFAISTAMTDSATVQPLYCVRTAADTA